MPAITISRKNLVLIGMPGAGKSTIGVILAKQTSRQFIDTDILIQTTHHCTLQEIVNADGYQKLREIEEEILLGIDLQNHVIATGGSAVYSDAAMQHLKKQGTVIFLDVNLKELERRVGDYKNRGIAKREDQSFDDLFQERAILYNKYADTTIASENLTPEAICEQIESEIQNRN